MELVIPVAALAGMYFLNKSKTSEPKPFENFTSNNDILNVNFPTQDGDIRDADSPEEVTSALSTGNRYEGVGVYTDKYFTPNSDMGMLKTKGPAMASQPGKFDSMIGTNVDSSYFKHNNMVPFFGAKMRTTHRESNGNESILDNYTGSGSQVINKKEVSSLFSPHESLSYAYGAPNQNDFYASRVNPSLKMSNVKPFGEVKVAPGLGLGYTAEGAGGYNSGMAMREKWVDRGVDELRVKTNPKASGYGLFGHEGPALSFVQERGSLGRQEKNRVDTTYEIGADRLMTTTGVVQGNLQIPTIIERDVARPETSQEYAGVAKMSQQSGSNHYVDGEYQVPRNIELGSYPLRPAVAKGKYLATDGDYSIQSNRAYLNNRTLSTNTGTDYFGAVRGALTEAVAPLMDILRPSRKENSVGTLRPYENPKASVPLTYVYNPNDRTKTTLREATETSPMHWNISANQRGGAYETTPHQPIENARYKTSDHYYAGNASAGEGTKQMRPVDAEFNQRNNNKKASTNVGYTTSGNIDSFNPQMNVEVSTQRANLLRNKRDVVPTLAVGLPDVSTMGQQTTRQMSQLYSAQHLDRNDGSVLSSLKTNEYAIPMVRSL